MDKLHHYIDLLNPDEENFPQGRYQSFDAICYLMDYAYNQYYKDCLPNIEHFAMLKTACFFQMNIKNENCLPEQEVAEPCFTARANEQIRVWHTRRVQMLCHCLIRNRLWRKRPTATGGDLVARRPAGGRAQAQEGVTSPARHEGGA